MWLGAYRASHLVRLVQFQVGTTTWNYLGNVLEPLRLPLAMMARRYACRGDTELAFNLIKRHLKLYLLWSAKTVIMQQQVWAVLIIAHILQALRLEIAGRAQGDPCEVSMALLIECLPDLARCGQNSVHLYAERGREARFIRPSARTMPHAPDIAVERIRSQPPDLPLCREPRYANRKCDRHDQTDIQLEWMGSNPPYETLVAPFGCMPSHPQAKGLSPMQAMTGYERIGNTLRHQPVDRIGVFEHFWSDTQRVWTEQGHLKPGENLGDHFDLDMGTFSAFSFVADLDFKPVVVEETAETILTRDGNGALLRRHKLHASTPEHVDFLVRDREGWEEHIKPHLVADPRRINFEGYRQAKEHARERGRFFCWSGVNVFELMHPVCGHLYMLQGMALDPDWIKDMVTTYARVIVELQEILFAQEGRPDGIWYYEDMGFKGRPFMSPAMYKEIIQPGHLSTFAYAKSLGLPIIVHSCGMVESLVPGLLEAGMDCLQVIEVKAGMDLLKLYQQYGDVLSFMGGIDVRVLYTNDRQQIDAELEAKIPVVKQKHGYMLHSDHSIPNTVHHDTYRYFVQRGIALGTT